MICRYIIALTFFIATSLCINCGRDIDCLAKNAQMTFLGRVVAVEQNNTNYFSAEVQPLCTMHSTLPNTKIDDEEYRRTVFVDGFGTHAGGSCNANSGVVGDTNLFFVWVNASAIHGQARRFGLYDPCYGAFKYDGQNAQQISNFIATHKSTVQTPVGVECPALPNPTNGGNGFVDLEQESNAILRYTLSSLALMASLLVLYLM